ncbi:radical SAM/SPASM domain-containing protein [Propionibacterium freudenreichii]|uniref:radical SAM/SPASM domain-containing protein n=1 Tax=Propionibacterium freudenreichii TaxID=1744 RepID=UPI0009BCFE4F|nr:radical SAM/SPASM domain-containing protein [Propionibacterium freudenreichii]
MEGFEGVLKRHMLTISVTNKCPARCAHCLAESSLSERNHFTASEIEQIYLSARELEEIGLVVMTGGEPTELGDDLFEAISRISISGVTVRLVTNACWATDSSRTKRMITKLREAGVNEINYSLDDYHAVWIPPENVIRAYKLSRAQGFSGVVVAAAEGPKSKYNLEWIKCHIDNDINVTHPDVIAKSENLEVAKDGTVYQAAIHGYSRVGRAHRMRSDLVIMREGLIDYNISCPEILDQIYVDSEGNIGACCGIRVTRNRVLSIGKVFEENLRDVYLRATSDLLMRAIHVLGPGWLLKFAAGLDDTVRVRDKYANICEMCEDLTTQENAIETLKNHADYIESKILNMVS